MPVPLFTDLQMDVPHYSIIFWSEEDGRYVVEVPELPGCMADGETYEGAIKNAQVIISECIDTSQRIGREVPMPRGILAYT